MYVLKILIANEKIINSISSMPILGKILIFDYTASYLRNVSYKNNNKINEYKAENKQLLGLTFIEKTPKYLLHKRISQNKSRTQAINFLIKTVRFNGLDLFDVLRVKIKI